MSQHCKSKLVEQHAAYQGPSRLRAGRGTKSQTLASRRKAEDDEKGSRRFSIACYHALPCGPVAWR